MPVSEDSYEEMEKVARVINERTNRISAHNILICNLTILDVPASDGSQLSNHLVEYLSIATETVKK